MPQQISPWLEAAYGWSYGENAWNTGMDSNMLKFSVMFDRNVDSIVGSLPSAVNGQVHYLTTDNRLYFAVDSTYFSTTVPKWFTFVIRATGVPWQFNGTVLVQIDSNTALDTRLDAVELTIASLGTAAYEDLVNLVTQAQLDVSEAQQSAYADATGQGIRADLSNDVDPLKGLNLLGYNSGETGAVGRTLQEKQLENVSLSDYSSLVDAVNTNHNVLIPSSVTSISLSTTDSLQVLPKLFRLKTEGELTLNLASGVHTTTSGNIINVGDNGLVTVKGATPVTTTLSSISNVTGTTGDYSVEVVVGSSTGMQVGDYLKLDNVVPLLPLSGDNSVFRVRVAENELLQQSALLGDITASSGGGSASFSSVTGALSDYISVGDLLTIKGQTREVTSVGASSVAIAGAWTLGVTSSRAWRLSRPNSGTVGTGGVSSTSVVGSGSFFTTESNVGDFLLCDGNMVLVTAIASNTALTVSPAVTLSASSKYSIITAAVAHEGTHEITSIVGDTVTVKNLWRGPFPPAKNRVSGGIAKAIKTVLKNTSAADGLHFSQNASLAFVNDMVIVSTAGTSGSHGIATNGRTAEGPTQLGPVSVFNGGDGLALVGWGRGAFVGIGCSFQTRRSHFMGSKEFGVWALENSSVGLREGVVSGTTGRGVQINAGATALITEAHFVGNSSDGLSQVAGSVVYGEIPVVYGNGSMGFRNNGGKLEANEGFSGANIASGVYTLSSADSNLTRMTVCANARENIETISGCSVNATEVWAVGGRGTTGSGRGIFATDSVVLASGAAVNGNFGTSVFISGIESSYTGQSNFINTASATLQARMNIANSKAPGGMTVTVSTGGSVWVDGVSPAPSVSGVARINEMANDGSLVKSETATSTGVSSLSVNGGSRLTFFSSVSHVFDCPSIPAGGQQSTTVPVPGATSTGMTALVNSNSLPAGVSLSAEISGAGTVTVKFNNNSAGDVDPGNATLTVMVLGSS